jgi:hypothetical protein
MEMMAETKQNIQDLVNKVQVFDFVLNTLNLSHKEHATEVEAQFKRASARKLVLLDEILRLNGADAA